MSNLRNRRAELRLKFFPEIQAGGYSRVETGASYHLRIRSLLRPTDVILDLGAGRGGGIEGVQPRFRREQLIFKGNCQRVVGVDIDDAVLQNPFVDEAHVVAIGEPLPFSSETFDLVCSDWTFEHVGDPEGFLAEARRVLKPGGWLCARTPNAWSYQGFVTRLIPNSLHTRIIRRLQPGRQERDVFETHFKMNTLPVLRKLFPDDKWLLIAFAVNTEPTYVANSALLWRLTAFVNWISPPAFRTILHVFAQKLPKL